MLTVDRAKILGTGSFGIVCEGVWEGNRVAVKQIPIDRAATNEQEKALKILDHINVNKLFYVEEDKDFKCFVLELCLASLDQLFLKENDLQKCRVSMPPQQEVLLQLAKGLEYIHKMKLVHRDIKPENALIFIDPENQQVVMKWGDFGLSKQVNERGTYTMSGGKENVALSEVRGRFNYCAPEILKLIDEGNSIKKRGTVKSDIYSEGLVFGYFVNDGVHPFGASDHQIAVNLRKNKPINLPKRKETRSLIEKMLKKKPKNRISSAEVVNQLIKIKKNTISNLLARKNANFPSVEEFNNLKEGIDIDVDEKGLTTLLHLVFQNNKKTGDVEGIVRFLIKNGANVNSKDEEGRNAFHEVMKSSMDQHLKSRMIRLLIRYGIQVHPESGSQSSELFTGKEFEGKKCLDYLVEEEIRLGWHEDCKSCEEILSIQEISRNRLQHHQMFVNIYSVFNLTLEDLEDWNQSNRKPDEAELDVENPTDWFRNKAEQYDDADMKKCFQVMAEISEQVKNGFDSSCFNCNNYEIYLRSMHRITEITNLKERKEEIEWFYLLPFDFPLPHDPIDTSESEEDKIKRKNKRKWETTLLNWAHKEKEAHRGEILKQSAEEKDCLPEKLQHLCHGQYLAVEMMTEIEKLCLYS